MTRHEKERVAWHLRVPVCETMHGARTHLRLMSDDDLRLLCRYFACDAAEIEDRFWRAVQNRRALLQWMADDMDTETLPFFDSGLW